MRILVVDDNHLFAELLEDQLSRAGYDVVRAGSAEEALIRRRMWEPDEVVLDVVLPGMDGLSLLRQLRALSLSEGLPPVPVILVSALPTLGDVEAELKDLGPVEVLHKPFDMPELLALLEKWRAKA